MKILHCPLSHIEIILPQIQKQPDSDDCGVFAIAFVTARVPGINLSDVSWEVSKMRIVQNQEEPMRLMEYLHLYGK